MARTRGVTITIKSNKKSKALVERTLAATERETCVVKLLEEYMTNRRRTPEGHESLFTGDWHARNVTTDDVVRIIRAVARKAGCKNVEDEFSTKSLRIGEVTTLVDKSDIQGHIIHKNGRRSTETWSKIYSRITRATEMKLAEHMS